MALTCRNVLPDFRPGRVSGAAQTQGVILVAGAWRSLWCWATDAEPSGFRSLTRGSAKSFLTVGREVGTRR
jgi:hypothetical protein